jgi:signal transduction histidine kinase
MTQNQQRILVLTNDFNIVERVRHAFGAPDYSLQFAYSHQDGLFALDNNEFDTALVDVNMVDRQSGSLSLTALAAQKPKLQVVGLQADGQPVSAPAQVSISAVTTGDLKKAVRKVPPSPVVEVTTPKSDTDPRRTTTEVAFPSENARRMRTARIISSAEEIHTLFTLSRTLTEVLDLEEVLNRIVEAARRLTNAEEGMILLPDDEGTQLFLRAKVGIDVEVARNFRIRTEDTIAGSVFATGKPRMIVQKGPHKVKTEYLVNALLYVPIIARGNTIGVLGVNNRVTEAVFEPKHQELLYNLASFAAIAIENARVHEETVDRTRELEALVQASQVLNSSLELDKTLPNICDQLIRVLNVNYAAIYDWNRAENSLRMTARTVRSVWAMGHEPRVFLEQRPGFQHVLRNGTSFSLSTHQANEDEQAFMSQLGMRGFCLVPITVNQKTTAIIQCVYVHNPASPLDTGIEERIQTRVFPLLPALTSQNNSLPTQELLTLLEYVNKATGCDWSELSVVSADQKQLVIRAIVGSVVWHSDEVSPQLDLYGCESLVDLLKTHQVIHRDPRGPACTQQFLDTTACRAAIGIPFVQRGKTVAFIALGDSRRHRIFSERDIGMGQAVAAQAATALENTRLVTDLEKSFADLKETQDRLVQTARLTAMGELAAAVAHQINNPLTTIMVDSEMMLLDENPESTNYPSLQAIHRAGKRAAGVARRLLAISRPGDPASPPMRIDVKDTILGVLSLVKLHIERDQIEVVVDLPDQPLPAVMAVTGQLDDIWLNLLMNAHDALVGCQDARLGISLAYPAESECIEVTVWDNGPGIPEKLQQEIFKPFFTTKPVGEGTGLGLHICRQTVERIGGSISVTSQPGEGARFLVKLPVKNGGTES